MQTSDLNLYDKNLKQTLKIMNFVILLHIPLFYGLTSFFKTEVSLAILGPLVLLGGQLVFEYVFKNLKLASIMMGFTFMALSALMIHLGKAMIEWHFHIFVFIGVLTLFANPWTIIAAAVTAAVHHLTFFFFLPESIFNYDANLGIVIIHALFVVAETIACVFIALKFKKVVMLQERLNTEIGPLISSIEGVSSTTKSSFSEIMSYSTDNSSSITEISSTAEEISKMVESTMRQIETSLVRMRETNTSVEESGKAITEGEKFLGALDRIKSKMDIIQNDSSHRLGEVEDSVNTISDKTSIINDIVFQTKLLSFNASVEAARAGEHGKGFAVVAEEMANLAETSGTASQEINNIVSQSKEQLNSSITSISESIQEFKSQIEEAVGLWSGINQKLSHSIESVKNNSDAQANSLNEISDAAKQQSAGVQQLSQALTQIDQSTHKTLKRLQEVTSLSNQLGEDSASLQHLHLSLDTDKVA